MSMFSKLLASVLLALCSAGCPASQDPIGPLSEAVAEPGLAGMWEYAEGEVWEYQQLHIYAGEDGKSLEILVAGEDGWVVLSGYVTAIGSRRYVNLRFHDGSQEARDDANEVSSTHPYWFCAIRFDEAGRLEVGMLGQLVEAAQAGRLRRSESRGYSGTLISDTSANIAALAAALSDEGVFKEAIVYRRVVQAPPAPENGN